MEASNIGIIGGGIAGHALAQFLARQGIKVTILEKITTPLPVGSGIMLQKPALHILGKLGVREAIESNGREIEGFFGENQNRKTIIDFNFKQFNPKLYGVGVHRGSIFSNLLQKSEENKNITIHYGEEIVEIQEVNDEVKVDSKTGKVFNFELVIVANGSGSLLRKNFPAIVKKSKIQSYAALWTTLPYKNEGGSHKITQVYDHSKHMYGLMPIGFATNEQKGEPLINFFCAISNEFYKTWDASKFDDWKSASYKIAPQYSDYIDKVEFKNLVTTPYYDARLSPFYKGRVAFVGDACHAISPHLSAGVNLALVDVYLLSKAIEESSDYTQAYKTYYEQRKAQINYYYYISKIITPLFQSQTDLGTIRDIVLPILYRFDWTKKIMGETILGVRKNLFKTIDKEFFEAN